MKKLYVYADFDWLKGVELVGELGYESLRGSDSYSFKFADSWIKKYNAITLSEDLNNDPGIQYTQPNKDIFGCFADALPDRWGRTLLLRREQKSAPPSIRQCIGKTTENIFIRMGVLYPRIVVKVFAEGNGIVLLYPAIGKLETITVRATKRFVAKFTNQLNLFEPIEIGIYIQLLHSTLLFFRRSFTLGQIHILQCPAQFIIFCQ